MTLDLPALLALAADAKKLADAATEGPWEVKYGPVTVYCQSQECSIASIEDKDDELYDWQTPDAALIAASRSLVPALADAVTRLVGMIDETQKPLLAESDLIDFWKSQGVEHRNAAIVSRKECERLAGRVAELEAALRPFSEYANRLDANDGGHPFASACPIRMDFDAEPESHPTLGDCRHAAAVLAAVLVTPVPPPLASSHR